MPRAAVLSIHARVRGTGPDTWEDRSLVQLWGPRFSAYVVATRDLAVFSLGRLPDEPDRRRAFEDLARRIDAFLDRGRMTYGEVGRGLGVRPNQLRYASPTGTVLIRWDGARQPTIWTVPPPDVDPRAARLELARRYLHVFGPATAAGFAQWAGIRPARGRAAFDALVGTLTPVGTPVGDAWILTRDEPEFRTAGGPAAPARLLPSGDAYFLLQGADRDLLCPTPPAVLSSGPRESGPAPSSWRAKSSAPGDGRTPMSRSRCGSAYRARNASPWRPKPRPCRCPVSGRVSGSIGTGCELERMSAPVPGVLKHWSHDRGRAGQ